jgi:hypothetical protein
MNEPEVMLDMLGGGERAPRTLAEGELSGVCVYAGAGVQDSAGKSGG